MANAKLYLSSVSALMLFACTPAATDTADTETETSPPEAATETVEAEPGLHPKLADVAAATYSIEPSHAFLTVTVGHNGGISDYRISFTNFDGNLVFDPNTPETSELTVSIDASTVETNYPGNYKATHENSQWESWNEDVSRDPKWLNSDTHPLIRFTATDIALTGDLTGTVTGDLTLLGTTKPVSLAVTYNGVANPPWFNGRDVIGFDATTTVKRSEFGMGAYIPNIGDEVEVTFSGEFLQDE